MKNLGMLFSLLLLCNLTFAQQISLKEQSIEQFKQENYALAISLMERAQVENPKDAEIYYYLGMFNHYNAYDSRTLKTYNTQSAQKILDYFDKALALNLNYGDAKAFYFIQCGAMAMDAYQRNDLNKMRFYLEKAFKRGVIPEWAIELGKNMLSSCDKDAILFTSGDYPLLLGLFLQLHGGYRTDISIVPMGMLDRPASLLALTTREHAAVLRGVKTGLTKEQILDMHPFKWKEQTFQLPIPANVLTRYGLNDGYTMDWIVKPDLTSERMASKIDGEEKSKRTYLSPTRANLWNIIESNSWERPVFFTNTFETYFMAGLENYFQNCGLVSRLTPLKTANTKFNIDTAVLEQFVFNTKLEKLKTIIGNDQPRESGVIGLYGLAYFWLADYYKSSGEKDKLLKLIEKYKQNLMIGFKPDVEKQVLHALDEMSK